METPPNKPKITLEQIKTILQTAKEIKALSDEPPMRFLTRKEREELWTKKTEGIASQKEKDLYDSYEKSKFRKNWLHKSLLCLETIYNRIWEEEFPLYQTIKETNQIIQDYGETPEYIEKIRPYINLINEHLDIAIKRLNEKYKGGQNE